MLRVPLISCIVALTFAALTGGTAAIYWWVGLVIFVLIYLGWEYHQVAQKAAAWYDETDEERRRNNL